MPYPRPTPFAWWGRSFDEPVYITIADLNLHEEPSVDSRIHSVVPADTWIELIERYDDRWYHVSVSRGWPDTGFILAEFLKYVEPPELWPLPNVAISDFGQQVAEEFLSQFDSLFIPVGTSYDGYLFSWFYQELPMPIYTCMPYILWDDSDGWPGKFYDHHGNEIDIDEAPFLLGSSLGTFVAYDFQLYDLDYDGVPEIVVTFARSTQMLSILFKFVNGQYTMVQGDFGGGFRFFYDAYGAQIMFSPGDGFSYFEFEDDTIHREPAQHPSLHHRMEMDGRIEIPRLSNLEDDIRESVIRRRFTEPITLTAVPTMGISDHGRQMAEDFISRFESLFVPFGHLQAYGNLQCLRTGDFINTDLPHFSMYWSRSAINPIIFDHHDNEVIIGDVPFFRDFGRGIFYAINFRLYDLDNNGIPTIQVIFSRDTWGDSALFRFIDGEYVEVSTTLFSFQFFRHPDGRVIIASCCGSYYLDDDGNLATFNFGDLTLRAEERIMSLVDLEEDIRESIMRRLSAN